jgi:CTP-dependent riboflavin kinase
MKRIPVGPMHVSHLKQKHKEDGLVPNDALLVFLRALGDLDVGVGVTWEELRAHLDVPSDIAKRAIALLARRKWISRSTRRAAAWRITQEGCLRA